jgi:hypothetical protein
VHAERDCVARLVGKRTGDEGSLIAANFDEPALAQFGQSIVHRHRTRVELLDDLLTGRHAAARLETTRKDRVA